MRALSKVAVAIAPFVLALLVIRSCASGEAERWRQRVAVADPAATVAIAEDDLIVIAPDADAGALAGRTVRSFRASLIEGHGDLLGHGRDRRIVVVLFSSVERLQQYAESERSANPFATDAEIRIHGFADGAKGAIFLPPESGLDTLRHETVHLVMGESHGDTVRYSPWLGEGLAQLFEAYDPDADPPRPPGIGPNHGPALRRMGVLDVDRLLALESYAEFTGDSAHRNYLDALVLTAFLYEQRDRSLLRRYIETERKQSSRRAQAFRDIYRHDEEPFRSECLTYVRHKSAPTPRDAGD